MAEKSDRTIRIEQAPSNQSKCQVCKEKINKGSSRVAHPSRSSNISVMKSIHPSCYLRQCVIFENSKCKSSCSATKRDIPKWELRLTMALTGCEGALKDKVFFHPPEASALVQQLLALEECSGVTIDSLTASLPEDARPWARDALAGVDVSARPAPTNMPEPKPRAPAKPRKRVADAGEEAEPKPAKKPRTAARKPYVKKSAEEDVEDNRQEALSDGEAID